MFQATLYKYHYILDRMKFTWFENFNKCRCMLRHYTSDWTCCMLSHTHPIIAHMHSVGTIRGQGLGERISVGTIKGGENSGKYGNNWFCHCHCPHRNCQISRSRPSTLASGQCCQEFRNNKKKCASKHSTRTMNATNHTFWLITCYLASSPGPFPAFQCFHTEMDLGMRLNATYTCS